jgi:hypothetical protein
MEYEKTLKIELLNEFSRNIYNRLLRYIVSHQMDRQNNNNLYTVLLDIFKRQLQINLFEISMTDLVKIESYWNTMDTYIKSVTGYTSINKM